MQAGICYDYWPKSQKSRYFIKFGAIFNHGQLYVALSRAGIRENTKNFIHNIQGVQDKYNANTNLQIEVGIYTKSIVL